MKEARQITPEELRRLFPRASISTIAANAARPAAPTHRPDAGTGAAERLAEVPPALLADRVRSERADPVPQRDPVHASPQADGGQKAGPARYLVRITSSRCRLLDEDNLCPKWHIDALRYCGLLPDDAPGQCKIETTQIRVGSKPEEKVKIQIFPPGTWE